MAKKQGKGRFDGKSFARRLPTGPGVYVMRDADGTALYVGKAANLAEEDFAVVKFEGVGVAART